MQSLEKLAQSYTFRNIFEIMCSYGQRVAAELTAKDGRLITLTYEKYGELARNIGHKAAAPGGIAGEKGKGQL